ncbi:exodeoxyribonuclease V subunit gamma [Nostocoides sp. F2B08]|uniref:exodeoxyribonuclease V subunit gamma n=1 Tax=Nostocoides sp. F2B08 TaxID=2653936 RepID=UPI001262F52A|nr:exodeoxyribonuclease V subunit gamma [Tetrasphaera sp. F2B08]KAB7746410.1 exodeoxyribonuclease V subunit gamma [Tetrasphaera sp. F2B08]
MTLHVHRGTSTDALADGLAALLADPLADPFAEEVVAAPAKGVERWLAQRLSHRLGAGSPGATDGVCAGVRFLTPHSLVAMVLGIEVGDPWHPDQLAWPVLRAIDESLGEPWARTLSDHLGHDVDGVEGELRRGRRFAVARRLAGLFADYDAQRPTMPADWRTGGAGDGLGGTLGEDLRWQPELWRRILAIVAAEPGTTEPPDQRRRRVVDALAAGDLGGLELPGRLSLFGHTRIPHAEIEVICALAEHRDVHLWLPQASPAAWDRLASTAAAGPVPREEDESGLLVEHPLLASLGRDARELQRMLALAGTSEDDRVGAVGDAQGASMLSLLQGDIAGDRVPSDADVAARVAPATDRSVQVHACHGRSRQVEVLRDVVADLLEQDPTLEPRDILVMCPDVEEYAPLIHAAFGLGGIVRQAATDAATRTSTPDSPPSRRAHPAHEFRVRIADRAPLSTNPLLALADRLVVLAGGRLTAGEVLDLARSEPVRRRFGLDDDALERLGDWVADAAVRWGLDEDHRETYRLRGLQQNTWRSGLDRILVGAAVDGEELDHVGTTLALDDLDSGDIDLAGRLAELVARLAHTMASMADAAAPKEWVEVLRDGVLGLADVPARDAWQVAQLEHELARIEAAAEPLGAGRLGLTDVHALLAERGAGRATRSSFRTGSLTVCTMVPMRSVPHRVVCLVGLDDGEFPRATATDGDDALARRPVTGERDVRSEDRQLLLDAVMSARETLVVTYTGFDEHTGHRKPPAVPLGELVDAVRATASGDGVDALVTDHPLQPFDARNLGAARSGAALLPGDRPFSYDPTALEAAREALSERSPRPRPVDLVLPARDETDVDLTDLVRFFDSPARAYLRSRLGMILPEVPEVRGEGIPIELDGLATWAIGERVLRSVLAGRDLDGICDAELWRGELPPGALGHRVLHDIAVEVRELTRVAWAVAGIGAPGVPLPREVVDLDVTLPSGRRIAGTVPGLVGDSVLTVTYSSIRAKQRLRSWIHSLVLAAAGTPYESHVVGREKRYRRSYRLHVTHGGHDADRAVELLDRLLDLRERGLREPIPLPPKTAYAWAATYLEGRADERAAFFSARKEWESNDSFENAFAKEQNDPEHEFVHGGPVPLTEILGTPLPEEQWEPGVSSRLGQLALRVWRPVLEDGTERMERS